MFEFLRWRHAKHDTPGSLVYAGKQHYFKPFVTHYCYDGQQMEESCPTLQEPLLSTPDKTDLFVVTGIHDPECIRTLGSAFGFPNLALEDVMNTGQRPKFAWADDETGFVVMKNLDVTTLRITSEQISFFWRDGLVLVFLEDESTLLDGVVARLRKGKGRIRTEGSDYLMVAILDALVDRNMDALALLGERAEEFEDNLDRHPSGEQLEQHYALRREVILLRNVLLPTREIFKHLLRDESEVADTAQPYLHDVAEHHEQAVEGTLALHDILTSMIDYQVSLIGIQTNRVMQFLTVISTIFIPLTFIAGVYGMNFRYMPELEWHYGYFISLGVMGAVGVLMVYYFIKKRLL